MATTLTDSKITPNGLLGECRHLSWTLVNGEAGNAAQFTEFADKCVQAVGTFGAGGSVQLEGSNDLVSPTNWAILHNPFDAQIVKTSATDDIETVLQNPMWIRPRVTAGDGTTSITINVVVRRTRGKTV